MKNRQTEVGRAARPRDPAARRHSIQNQIF